jgi:streptomycin 6-kinase
MDRIIPGVALGDLTELPTFDEIAGMLRPLTGQPAPDPDLPNLFDWLRDRLTDDHLNDLPRGRTVAPLAERRQALASLDELARDHVPGLCDGDASPWNILTGNQLYLIDPRGVAGEISFDLAIIAIKGRCLSHKSISALTRALSISLPRVNIWATISQAARV